MKTTTDISTDCISLLRDLIQVASLSGQEEKTADIIASFLARRGIACQRIHHNIIAKSIHWSEEQPVVVLNSHHDTVKIGEGWTYDPLGAEVVDGKLYGRGSNDAGGALVSLIGAFVELFDKGLPYNLMLIASGEEENFGPHGVSSVLKNLDRAPDLAIVGEPTQMQIGIAEKGLIVIDAVTEGRSGHAARDNGVNALYKATEDIEFIKQLVWAKISDHLGTTKTTVTQISSGTQHNVIPDQCSYVIDCRVNEKYTLQEVVDILDVGTHAKLTPRSLKWHPSGIDKNHPVVMSGLKIGRPLIGSPTLSDQVHFSCPSIKIGPGKSERSHTTDEFIYLDEIREGIEIYLALLRDLQL